MSVKLALAIVVLAMIAGAFFYIKSLGKVECENKQKTVIIEGVKHRELIEHENKTISRTAIIDKLNDSGWLRE